MGVKGIQGEARPLPAQVVARCLEDDLCHVAMWFPWQPASSRCMFLWCSCLGVSSEQSVVSCLSVTSYSIVSLLKSHSALVRAETMSSFEEESNSLAPVGC